MSDSDDKENAGSGGSDAEKVQIRKLTDELDLSRAALGDADLDRIIGADGSAGGMLLSPADSEDDGGDGSPLSLPHSVFEDTEDGLSVNFALPSPAHRGASRGGGRHGPSSAAAAAAADDVMRQRVSLLEQKNALLEGELAGVRAQYRRDVTLAAQAADTEMAGVHQQLAAVEAQVPLLRRRLVDAKGQFRELGISDLLAAELSRKPAPSLSLLEHVQLRVHRTVSEYKGQAEAARRELQASKEALATAQEAAEVALRETALRARRAERRAEAAEAEAEQGETTRAELQARLEAAAALASERARKGDSYDATRAKLDALEAEQRVGREQLRKNEAAVERAAAEREAARAEAAAALRSAEVLKTDVAYLQREADAARGAAQRAERDADEARAAERTTARTAAELRDELARAREEGRASYEERLAAALRTLQERSRAELAEVREAASGVAERERRVLEQARDGAVSEAARLRDELGALRREREELVLRQAALRAGHERDLSESRAQLKVKQFELTRVGASYEERLQALRQAELEAEMRAKRFDVLQGQYGALEADTAKQVAVLQVALAAERERVHSYEQLELELDGAILQTAKQEVLGGGGGGGDGGEEEDGGQVAATLLSGGGGGGGGGALCVMPTDARRRVRQSILLAQKVLRLEADCSALRLSHAEARRAQSVAEEKLGVAEQQLAHLSQPQQYLVDSIRQREAELGEARAALAALEAQCTEARAARAEAERVTASMGTELRRAAARASQLEDLRAQLVTLQASVGAGVAAAAAFQQQQQQQQQEEVVEEVEDEPAAVPADKATLQNVASAAATDAVGAAAAQLSPAKSPRWAAAGADAGEEDAGLTVVAPTPEELMVAAPGSSKSSASGTPKWRKSVRASTASDAGFR